MKWGVPSGNEVGGVPQVMKWGGGGGCLSVSEGGAVPSHALSVQSDAVQAAKVNMFGVLTRETFEWHPHNTLCKRFNVPEPYPRWVWVWGCVSCIMFGEWHG